MSPGALIGVPIYTLADYAGMGDAPSSLRKAGLNRVVQGRIDQGDVELPSLKTDALEGRVKNLAHFKECTSRIYEATKSIKAERVLILGGECSETVGAMAGLGAVFGGRAGMLWMDAHGDYNTPESSPSGYIGGMCLAMACGRGLGLDLNMPLSDERLAHVGSRDLDAPGKHLISAYGWFVRKHLIAF